MAIKVNVLGAGPAGMYTAALLKKSLPSADVALYEQGTRERLSAGIGYVFIPQHFTDLDLIDPGIKERLSVESPRWDFNVVITKSGRVVPRKAKFPSQGVLRSQLMSGLEEAVTRLGIPLYFEEHITPSTFDRYCEADLVVVATGVKRFLSDEQVTPFTICEAESPVQYAWFSLPRNLKTHTLSLSTLKGIPFAANMYPVTSERSAVVVEVLPTQLTSFCTQGNTLGFELSPEDFSPVRVRGAQSPLVGNVLLVGDAGCTPYFCTGAGLSTAFHVAQKLVGAITAPMWTLSDRLQAFSVGLGQYYLSTLNTSIEMINTKARVLSRFDSLSEDEQTFLLTGRRLD